jgi:hypothetical protein
MVRGRAQARALCEGAALHPAETPALGARAAEADDPRTASLRLDSGETVILALRAHWLLIGAVMLPALLAIGLVAAMMLAVQVTLAPGLSRTFMLVLLAALMASFAMGVLEHRARLYVLTDRRVLRRSGVLRTRIHELALGDVDGVEMQPTPDPANAKVGILVFSATSGKLAWEFVPEPAKALVIAREAIDRYGHHPTPKA